MTKFSDISPENRAMIISLPYKIGIWISNSDDNEKTGLDDKRERQALEAIISRMARAHRKMPFAAHIMKQVENAKGQWSAWALQSEEAQVLSELEKSLEIVSKTLPKGYAGQYKQTVWNVAVTVAQAFGEQVDPDNEMHVDRFFAWLGSFMSTPKLQKTPENMSAAEKTALKKLRALLK